MRFNKQIAVILVLSSLLISAIGAALFLYYENENTKVENAKQLTVFIAKKDIKKNSLIKEDDIVKTLIAKKYLLAKPLLKKEIINKFAKETIYKNEMFRSEKIVSKIGREGAEILPSKFNSYNIAFKRFENPNYSLLKGDIVNIITVYPKSKARDNINFNVRYVTKQINIIGFLDEGKVVEKAFRKVKRKVKSKNKKNKTPKYEMVKVFADEIVLDIKDQTIIALTNDYNKGKQLWMVKTNKVIIPPKKEKVKPVATKVGKKTKTKKRTYPYRMYRMKDVSRTRTAVIEYADSSIPEVTQKAVIKSNSKQQCIALNKMLIGVDKKVHLRSIPKFTGRIKRIVYKNYLIPYKIKVNKYWYEVCDGRYVHRNEVMEIDYNKAQGLLNGTKKKTTVKKTTTKK